jgi:hypothetical protein
MNKLFKFAYPTLFGVILYSIVLQLRIKYAYPHDTTATTKCWLLFMIVLCSASILFTLPSFEKGVADEIRSYFFPLLVIMGFAVMLFGIPYYFMYTGAFFKLAGHELPLTATFLTVVWLGLLRMEGKNTPPKVFCAILTGATTYVFLYNIAGILWYSHFFGR